jgi:alginate O-acetyltransferase complex protein AlgI
MVVGGLWHGANWTYVLWGTYHGVLIVIQRFLEDRFESARRFFSSDSPVLSAFNIFLTFNLVSFGWVIFRSETMAKAFEIITRCFVSDFSFDSSKAPIALMLGLAMASHVIRSKWNMEEWFIRRSTTFQAFGYACATIAIFLFFTSEQRFIYFQF